MGTFTTGIKRKTARQTRSINPSTMGIPAPITVAAGGEGSGAQVPATSSPLGPWLDPLRILRASWSFFPRLGFVLGLLGLAGAFTIGVVVNSTTYTLTGSLQLLSGDAPFLADRDTVAYRPPEIQPRELQTLLEQQFLYERLLPIAGAEGEGVARFRDRFAINYGRDSGIFRVSFAKADSPRQSEEVLDTFFQIVLTTVRDLLTARVQKDLDYYQRNIEDNERDLANLNSQLDAFRRKHGFIYLEQAVSERQARATRLEDALIAAKARITELEISMTEIPKMLAAAPTTDQGLAATPEAALTQKRLEISRLQAVYTDLHPRLKAAREELGKLEEELLRQANDPKSNLQMQRMSDQLRLIQIQRPVLNRQIEELETQLAAAKAELERMPALSAEFMIIERKREQQEGLLRRLRSRREEIEIARNTAVNRLRILDQPVASNAVTTPVWLKALALGAGGLALGAGAAGAYALFRALGDRQLRTLSDCNLVLRPERLSRVPDPWRTAEDERMRWLQDLGGQILRRHRRFLVIPTLDPDFNTALLHSLAVQIGRSGLRVLVIAPGEMASADETGAPLEAPGAMASGITHVIHRQQSLDEVSVNVADNVHWTDWGDVHELLERLPSGHLESVLGEELEDFGESQVVLAMPPDLDQTLLQRLAAMSEAIVVLVDPNDDLGEELHDLVTTSTKPVAMVVLR